MIFKHRLRRAKVSKMHLITLFTLTVVGFVAAHPVDKVGVADIAIDVQTRNTAIEQLILGLIEELREVMINGSDDIPVLDPLEVDNVRLDMDDFGLENSHLELADLVVGGLSTFVIDDFSFTSMPTILQPFRHNMILNGHIPEINVNADNYDLNVAALGFTVFGNGVATLKIIQPRLELNMMVNLNIISGISLRILSAEARFGLVAFESSTTGFFNDDSLNDFVNAFLGELVPELLTFYEDDISAVLSELIVEFGNDLLDTINIGDLLPMDEIIKMAGLPVPEKIIA